MIEGDVSQPLRTLLEFDSQQHDVPIAYHRHSLARARTEEPFRRAIEVHVHTHPEARDIVFPVAGESIAIKAAVCLGRLDGEPVGPLSDLGVPLCFVQDRRILIPFDLEGLESDVPNAVNKLWADISELAFFRAVKHVRAYDYADEKKRYAQIKARALSRWADSVRRDLDDNSYEIERKTNEIGELVVKTEEQRAALDHFEHCKPRRVEEDAVREFESLMKLTPRPYRTVTFTDDALSAETQEITIAYDGQTYDFGRFLVTIRFENDRLTIASLEGGRTVEGYPHPHVSGDGVPCLGNIGVSLAKLLARKEYPPALVVIDQFLRSYNDGNPYVKIEKFDPDYEEENDHERCYENSSTLDCVDCSDDDCPHWEGRYENCDEASDLDRCLRCRCCEALQRRIDSCREDTPAPECVTCTREGCPFAGDENACRDAVDPSECADCVNTTCSHHPKEEAPDEGEDRPAGTGTHPALRGSRSRRGVGAGDRRAG